MVWCQVSSEQVFFCETPSYVKENIALLSKIHNICRNDVKDQKEAEFCIPWCNSREMLPKWECIKSFKRFFLSRLRRKPRTAPDKTVAYIWAHVYGWTKSFIRTLSLGKPYVDTNENAIVSYKNKIDQLIKIIYG